MYRQIYRDKILYYVATQRFNSPKNPYNKTLILRYADPTRGVHTLFVRRDSCYEVVLLVRLNELVPKRLKINLVPYFLLLWYRDSVIR
jgi:hypothetical protein